MVMITRASRSGLGSEGSGPSENEKCDGIEAAVSAAIREIILKMFGTIKTKLIALFDEWYVVVANTDVAAVTVVVDVAASPGEREMPNR